MILTGEAVPDYLVVQNLLLVASQMSQRERAWRAFIADLDINEGSQQEHFLREGSSQIRSLLEAQGDLSSAESEEPLLECYRAMGAVWREFLSIRAEEGGSTEKLDSALERLRNGLTQIISPESQSSIGEDHSRLFRAFNGSDNGGVKQ